jgi:hypothetical protein
MKKIKLLLKKILPHSFIEMLRVPLSFYQWKQRDYLEYAPQVCEGENI